MSSRLMYYPGGRPLFSKRLQKLILLQFLLSVIVFLLFKFSKNSLDILNVVFAFELCLKKNSLLGKPRL